MLNKKGVRNILCAVLLSISFISAVFALEGKFIPPEGKILFFAGQNKEAVDEYVKTVKIVPAGVMSYTSVHHADSLIEGMDFGAGENWALYTLDKYPNTCWQAGLYLVDALEQVIDGTYDYNIDTLGNFIKSVGRPVFLRIGYEFDGPHNHYDPEKYITAFKYIVDKLRAKGVDNVAYVWHSNAAPVDRPPMDWYPGDEYVDWFGISYFDQDEKYMEPMIALAKEHNKPVMVAEASPARIGTASGEEAWEVWFKRYFNFINNNGIKCFCYINLDWDSYPLFKDLKWGDARLKSNKFIKKHWIEEIKKDKYLKASKDLFSQIGFK